MASYHYDEAGTMAAYFLITFLFLVLVPTTVSLLTGAKSGGATSERDRYGCQCQACVQQRQKIRANEGGVFPKLGRKAMFVLAGWALFAFVSYKVTTTNIENKVYDPFEILGIRTGSTEKEIKSHYKKLSRKFHPDKVKLGVNETMESVSNYFVELTKAYKSLTDETIRKNWELYGHPDGRQEVSMGIALPQWIIESKNNVYVLGMYGIVFGGALPVIVGKWWFGNRSKTKDGVEAQTAGMLFKGLKEDASVEDVVALLARAANLEKSGEGVGEVLGKVEERVGKAKWAEIAKEVEGDKKALVLLYAHLLRIPLDNPALEKDQQTLLLSLPPLLNSLLSISTTRSFMSATLSIMRLHAHLAQAVPPPSLAGKKAYLTQLPGIKEEELKEVSGVEEVLEVLREKGDGRVEEVRKVVEKGGIELVDVGFRVVGERIITPSSFINLLVKLRLSPPGQAKPKPSQEADEGEKKRNAELDEKFLNGKKDAEELTAGETANANNGWAHAPYWPSYRKPTYWLLLADPKSNRLVVPPARISDVPKAKGGGRDYRCYKMQFQGPPQAQTFTWKVMLVSDTWVGEEVGAEVVLKIDDLTALRTDEQGIEDEISDPEEDSLAGQMAAMRGGSVKKTGAGEDGESSSDEESGTDDDERGGKGESSSDSD